MIKREIIFQKIFGRVSGPPEYTPGITTAKNINDIFSQTDHQVLSVSSEKRVVEAMSSPFLD